MFLVLTVVMSMIMIILKVIIKSRSSNMALLFLTFVVIRLLTPQIVDLVLMEREKKKKIIWVRIELRKNTVLRNFSY